MTDEPSLDAALRSMLHAEAEGWTPSANPASLAERLLGSMEDAERSAERRARVSTHRRPGGSASRGLGTRIRPFTVAFLAVVLVASGVGALAATLHTAAPRQTRPSGTSPTSVLPSSVPGSSVPGTTAGGTAGAPPMPALSSDPSTVPPVRPGGVLAPRSAVPWSSVGPGWTLVLYDSARCSCGVPLRVEGPGWEALLLVSPSGARYTMAHWAVRPAVHWTLLDWSRATRTALLTGFSDNPSASTTFELDLVTGAEARVAAAGVTGFAPDGTDLLASSTTSGDVTTIDVLRPDGTLLSRIASAPGAAVYVVPGGLVVKDAGGLRHVTGRASKNLDPAGLTCSFLQYWSTTSILADCGRSASSTPTRWILSWDRAPRRFSLPAATVSGPSGSPWNGQPSRPLAIYEMPSGTYATDAGACAATFVVEQTGATATQLVPPGVSPAANVRIAGTSGENLLMSVAGGCTVAGRWLLYDTTTGSWKTLLGSYAGEVGLVSEVVYPQFAQ